MFNLTEKLINREFVFFMLSIEFISWVRQDFLIFSLVFCTCKNVKKSFLTCEINKFHIQPVNIELYCQYDCMKIICSLMSWYMYWSFNYFITIWLKSDLHLRCCIEDLITLHYWLYSSELCMNFVFAYCVWFWPVR